MDMSTQQYLESAGEACPVSAGGDRVVSLRTCLTANYDRLQRRLTRHLGCPELASESLHDAWLRLEDAVACSAVQNPEAYVFRVVCNIAMDRLRGNRSRHYGGDADDDLDHIADRAPGPEAIAEARSDAAAVERAIRRLPHRHQAILESLRLDEMTRQEVALRHGLSLRRVDTVLRQALDYCARETGHRVMAGVSAPRRPLPQRRV
jgi:RNA polymerase sigma-70 factor (ECF subfamily)